MGFSRYDIYWFLKETHVMGMKIGVIISLLLVSILTAGTSMGKETKKMKQLTITSPAFAEGGAIPLRYTCDGKDINPPLAFGVAPDGARSLALIVDDPDAPVGTWVHWVMWNIPHDVREIIENSFPEGAKQGLNDWKRNSYGGPCPPSGTHRYYFKIYALDKTLDIPPTADKAALEKAMSGHILAQGQLMGTYRRR
jgi:Raf kinase inhibitor-like YbhB/YbcL family protein